MDGDGDGFGDETDSGVPFCESYSGYSDDPSDCDDGAYAVNPDATEVCDDIDNDCDDDIDDDDGSTDYTGEITYYVDDDGDGDGDSSDPGTEYCDQPASTSTNADDCNDAFAEINLAATEVCDGADNDCDDVTDEGYDSDSDGTPDCQDGEDCDGLDNDGDELIDEGYDSDSDGTADCYDTEVCDGVDNDGDGLVDDDDDEALDEGGDPWGTAVDLSTATNWYVDDDEDGFGSSGAPPDLLCEAPAGTVADDSDCNDGDSAINPDATEVCDELDVDEDCDGDSDDADSNVDYTGETTYYIDFDEDTYGDSADEGAPACEQPLSTSVNALDCDDTESAINPDANEVCDSVDNDCDGDVDDDDANIDPATQSTYYVDADEDGDGSDADSGTLYCLVPSTHSDNQDDCDDSDAAINDDATEVCDNADNDCDGLIDDLDDDTDYTGETTYYADVDGDGDGATSDGGQAYCNEPSDSSTNADDCDDEDSGINEDATEICDSEDVDENCNGLADDLDGTTDYTGVSLYYPDSDGDTYGDEEDAGAAYCDPDSSLVVDATDCDDDETTVNPGGTEVCDGAADEDCDGDVDEDGAFDAQAWYADGDGDSYGDGDSSILSCEVPTGYVADATDCDDLDEDSFPGGIETCDGTADQDCDGDVDEDGASDASTWYADADGDSYGDSAVTSVACEVPSGYVSDATDCDDLDEDSYPGGTETCDGTADEDCDGDVDEDGASDASTWYADDDGDAFGDSSDSTAACDAPGGYVSDATDCDDGDDEENPGVTWYPDVDEDSYGDPDSTSNACERADEGDVTDNTDCDDGDATENPDVTWYVDGDGDGYGDAFNSSDCERSAKTDVTDATDCNDLDAGSNPDVDWYADSDGDLYGDPDVSTNCQPSLPSDVTDNTDCDDGEATVNPGETESATELDNDCDDMVDETFRSAGDLLITEVMANPEPTGSEPDNEFLENEFLEIYNTTSGTMDPGGVYVTTSCDSGSGFYLPKETLSIAAGDYAVLCFDDTTLGASCDYIYGTDGNDASSLGVTFSEDFCLTNDGATLDLDLNAANLDTVVYEGSDDWPSDKAGYSIMLVTGYYDETDNDDGLNWCHPADTEEYDTGNYGSPGSLGTCE